MTNQTDALISECLNQAESCLYTSTSLFIWLRDAKRLNTFLSASQIVVGALASGVALANYPVIAAIIAFLAGVLPAIYEKLNFSQHIEEIQSQAGSYKNLQDRFRQAATITALDSNPDGLKLEFAVLMRQMEELRAKPITAPERYFLAAQDKIKAGHYNFDNASGTTAGQ